MAKVTHNKTVIADVPLGDVDGVLASLELDRGDVEITLTGRELADLRAQAGAEIMQKMRNAGVPQSALTGLLCDVSQYGAYANALSIVALGEHGTAAQKAYIKGTNALPGAKAFLAALDAEEGGIAIPALEKGMEAILADLKAVLDAYAQAKGDPA